MNITTDREAFEYVRDQLLKQKERSIYEEDCAYRGFSDSLKNEIAINLFGKPFDYYMMNLDEDDYEHGFDVFRDALLEHGPNLKCAVGHLITDQHYERHFETRSANEADILEAVAASNPNWEMNEKSQELLEKLQLVHDRFNIEKWAKQFEDFIFDDNGGYKGLKSDL